MYIVRCVAGDAGAADITKTAVLMTGGAGDKLVRPGQRKRGNVVVEVIDLPVAGAVACNTKVAKLTHVRVIGAVTANACRLSLPIRLAVRVAVDAGNA